MSSESGSEVRAGESAEERLRWKNMLKYFAKRQEVSRHSLLGRRFNVGDYSGSNGELGCVNPEFNELPVGSPTFRRAAV